MSLAVIKARLDKLLAEPEPRIALLTGEWGTGKTFQWTSAIKRRRGRHDIGRLRYAYVSLFGLSSLAEVRRRVAEEMLFAMEVPDVGGSLGDRLHEWRFQPWKLTKLLPLIPQTGKLESILNELSFSFVKEGVVCFDDLERAPPTLAPADVLGLASFLREQRSCRVALLTNEAKIGETGKKTFLQYLERVVDETLTLAPTSAESAQIAMADDDSHAARFLAEAVIDLNIVNIRVVAKLHAIARELQQCLQIYPEGVLKHAVRALALFGAGILAPSAKLPPIEYLETYGSDQWAQFFRRKKDELSNEEKQHAEWDAFIERYGQGATDAFDLEIARSVRSGFVDVDALRPHADNIAAEVRLEEYRAAFRATFDLVWESLADNKKEVVKALRDLVAKHAHHMGTRDMHRAFDVLYELVGRDEAMETLEAFIAANQERPGVFNLDHDTFGDITSPAFRDRIAQEAKKHAAPVQVDASLDSIDFSRGWHPDDVKRIAEASEEELYQLLKPVTGDLLRDRLRTLDGMSRHSGPEYAEAHKRAVTVFKRLAAESDINALRMRRLIPQGSD